MHKQEEYGALQHPIKDWVPVQPYSQVCLVPVQDFQGGDTLTLDTFSSQVDELSRFTIWMSKRPVVRLARTHLGGGGLRSGICQVHTLSTMHV